MAVRGTDSSANSILFRNQWFLFQVAQHLHIKGVSYFRLTPCTQAGVSLTCVESTPSDPSPEPNTLRLS
eukprot:5434962-Amphidinium_carterae.1